MTGFSQALETQKADELGADDFLAKPFNESDLLEIIKKYFEDAKAPAADSVDIDKDFCKNISRRFHFGKRG